MVWAQNKAWKVNNGWVFSIFSKAPILSCQISETLKWNHYYARTLNCSVSHFHKINPFWIFIFILKIWPWGNWWPQLAQNDDLVLTQIRASSKLKLNIFVVVNNKHVPENKVLNGALTNFCFLRVFYKLINILWKIGTLK